MPWRVLSGYRLYQVHPAYLASPSPSPTPGGSSSSPSSPTRPDLVATGLPSPSPATNAYSAASSFFAHASPVSPSTSTTPVAVPGLSLFVPAVRFFFNASSLPSLHHSLPSQRHRIHNRAASKQHIRHHSSTTPTKAATAGHQYWAQQTDEEAIPSLHRPQYEHQQQHRLEHQHQHYKKPRMDPTIAKLFTSNEQWKEAVGQAEPNFFTESAKGQAPKVTSSPSSFLSIFSRNSKTWYSYILLSRWIGPLDWLR